MIVVKAIALVLSAIGLVLIVVSPGSMKEQGQISRVSKRISTLERIQLKGGSVIETSTVTTTQYNH